MVCNTNNAQQKYYKKTKKVKNCIRIPQTISECLILVRYSNSQLYCVTRQPGSVPW